MQVNKVKETGRHEAKGSSCRGFTQAAGASLTLFTAQAENHTVQVEKVLCDANIKRVELLAPPVIQLMVSLALEISTNELHVI